MKRQRSASFNPSIHGARGLFALMVFVFHVANSGLAGFLPADAPLTLYLLGSFQFGVELFFGISGYVILGALARAPSMRSFAWDRATRIFPLLWTTILAITAISIVTHYWLPSLGEWLLNLLAPPPFIHVGQVNPAAWSLGYEITFYALCTVFWWLRSRGQTWWKPVAVVTGVVLLALFPRGALFPAGLAIAAGLPRTPFIRRLAGWPLPMLLACLLCWRLIELANGGDMMTVTPLDMPFTDWLATAPLLVGSALLGGMALLGIAMGKGLLSATLRTAPLQWLGTISYSFYLWHPVVMAPVKYLLKLSGMAAAAGPAAQLVFAVVALPIALLVAHYSQRWIEVQLTRWLRRHGPSEGKGHAPVTASPYPTASTR
ncbi:acyltransferase [Sphingosinicellaceae bacterium]|nr:acyltransferase [Sphingosinicellaceae bacterium]